MSTAARPRRAATNGRAPGRSRRSSTSAAAPKTAALTVRAAVTPPAVVPRNSAGPPAGAVEDVQSRADTRRIPINRVGIKDIRHPVRVKDRSRGEQHTVANFNMYVSLPHDFKGTHMSRFVEILHHEREISVESFRGILTEMAERLDANAGHIEMTFPYFITKRAPVSGVESLMDYQASLIGEVRDGDTRLWLKVVVPVTSLCPCSKKISERGAHNQRSHVTIKARLRSHMWIEELIDIAESEASCELYGILKRPDEKYVTERAYDNPKFVEDMVRDVAVRLNHEERIGAYVVESENFESIHNHSAYAQIDCDKDADVQSAGASKQKSRDN